MEAIDFAKNEKWTHNHLNVFHRGFTSEQDKGRDNIQIINGNDRGRHIEYVICRMFDESIQSFVDLRIHWQKIVDFYDRRQPLGLKPITVEGIIWYGGGFTFAKAWSAWNKDRGTWELVQIGAGAYGDDIVLMVEKKE